MTATSTGSTETISRSIPHSSHWTVSPSSTSSTSTIIGLSHSGHTTAMIEPPGTWVRPPTYSTTLIGLWEQHSRTTPVIYLAAFPPIRQAYDCNSISVSTQGEFQ